MTEIRSHAAVWLGLVLKTARSEPPEKTGAGFGPFWLGIGKDAMLPWSAEFFGSVALAHEPSMYMSSLPRPKSSFGPPEVAPATPSSVSPTYLDWGPLAGVYRPTEYLIAASSCAEVRSAVHVLPLWVAIWPPAPQMKLANALVSLVIASKPVVPG